MNWKLLSKVLEILMIVIGLVAAFHGEYAKAAFFIVLAGTFTSQRREWK